MQVKRVNFKTVDFWDDVEKGKVQLNIYFQIFLEEFSNEMSKSVVLFEGFLLLRDWLLVPHASACLR